MRNGFLISMATGFCLSAGAMTFESDGAFLSLDEHNGAVEYLRGADGVPRTVTAPEAFVLQLLDKAGNPVRLASREFRYSSEGNVLSYAHENGLRVRVRVRAEGGAFYLALRA